MQKYVNIQSQIKWDVYKIETLACYRAVCEASMNLRFVCFFYSWIIWVTQWIVAVPPPPQKKKKKKISCDSAGSQLTMCPLFHLLMSRKLLLDWVYSPWPSWDHRGGSWLIWRTTRRKSSMAILRVYLACSVSVFSDSLGPSHLF